jgi:tRNA (guanine-N7-)-methyltransferase
MRIAPSYQAHFAPMQAPRRIRSFVLRAGRTTAAQERALVELWPRYGIELGGEVLNLDALFARRAPRCLEIGFGTGEVIGALAEQHADIDYIGIEVHRSGVGRLLLHAEQRGLRNLRVISADAVEVLRERIADGAFDEVLIFFPDPWHKKRHRKRRLIDAEFVSTLAAKMRGGGVLRLATDWQDYAEQMLAVCDANTDFTTLGGAGGYAARPDFRQPTRFERRGERLGHGVWDLAYLRREKAAANTVDDELHGQRRENDAG